LFSAGILTLEERNFSDSACLARQEGGVEGKRRASIGKELGEEQEVKVFSTHSQIGRIRFFGAGAGEKKKPGHVYQNAKMKKTWKRVTRKQIT